MVHFYVKFEVSLQFYKYHNYVVYIYHKESLYIVSYVIILA